MDTESIYSTNFHFSSVKGRLVNELKISFGESPAVAAAIAQTADTIYRSEGDLTTSGTILYNALSINEPSGKPLSQCKRVSVKLTLWNESDDNIKVIKSRKKEVLHRITQEAYEQNGVLTIEDCERVMLTSVRTLKSYINEFRKDNIFLPLRGYVHSTGRGQTHKTEIICYYLQGMEFSDIQKRTYHSVSAISRYLTIFSRIVICHAKQHMKSDEIAKVVGVSKELVLQYLQIYEQYEKQQNERLHMILQPAEFQEYILPFKKKMVIV